MADSNKPKDAGGSGGGGEGEAPKPTLLGGLIGACFACACCLLCAPLLCCCACCGAADAAAQKAQGRRWDGVLRRWVTDNLVEEEGGLRDVPDDDGDILKGFEAESAEAAAADSGAASDAAAAVKETAYYDALGVAPDADDKKIKRAYYVNARRWHPDRNPSEEAKAKFQAIGEAYQVLSDPKLRAAYDREGEAGLSGDRTGVSPEKLDPSLVFTFLFGSDAFEDIVGRLKVVTQTMAAGGGDGEDGIAQEKMLELERRRIVRLALRLRDRIRAYVEGGDAEAARSAWRDEAERLVEVRYGEEILHTVGRTYHLVATQCIGSWGEGMEAKITEHEMKAGAARAAYEGAQKMQNRGGGGGDEGGGEAEDELPTYIELMWNVTVIDISSTLREVVLKVLSDKSVPGDVRKKRAEAVQALGEIFESQKSKKAERDKRSVRGLYESAAQAAMEDTLNKMRQEEEKHAKEDAADAA